MSPKPEQLSAEEIAAEWRAKGLETLEDVASLAARSANQGEPAAMPVDVDSMMRETPPELARTLKHPPNEGPVLVNGNKVEDLSDFDGQPLHFIGDRDAFAAGMLPAFTSTAPIGEFLRDRQTRTFAGSSLPMNQAFFEHAGFGGAQKSVAAFNMFADLTRVVREVFWQNWNDEISSLGACACFITIWEHTWLSGSSVTIAPGGPIEYVGNAWNDRISAIQSWGP
jgi:hypothetical protein